MTERVEYRAPKGTDYHERLWALRHHMDAIADALEPAGWRRLRKVEAAAILRRVKLAIDDDDARHAQADEHFNEWRAALGVGRFLRELGWMIRQDARLAARAGA